MIAVIDYGASNLRSVLHALDYLGVAARVAAEPDDLRGAQAIILPGVGAFGAGMARLRELGFELAIQHQVGRGVPLLGICLGMQFLFEASEEMGEHTGLSLLAGRVVRFPALPGLKIPHMGWNQLQPVRESPLLDGIAPGDYAYFVHSYFCAPIDPADVLATCDYGLAFPAIVGRDNIYGVQFHPEKSQAVGLQLLRNFAAIAGTQHLKTGSTVIYHL